MEQGFKLSIATKGQKATNATRPELSLTPTYNQFRLNPLATKALDLEDGDYITIVEDNDKSWKGRFYIAVGTVENGAKLAAINKKKGVGRTLTFTFSGVYSRMLQGDGNAQNLAPDILSNEGFLTKHITKGQNASYVATKKIHWGIGEGMEVEIDGEEMTVYPLVEAKEENYTPRNMSGNDSKLSQEDASVGE